MSKVVWLFLTILLSASPCLSEESGPRESERKAETANSSDQKGDGSQQSQTPFPLWIAGQPIAPIVNVYTGRHGGEISQCAAYKDGKEWGALIWCRSWEWIDSERVIAIFTVIMGVATVILGGVTWKLWQVTGKLVKGADDTARRQLRAYVHIDEATIKSTKFAECPIITLIAKNFGKTPAYRVEWRTGFEFFSSLKEDDLPAPITERGHAPLGPTASVIRVEQWRDSFGEETIRQMKTGTGALYVWGILKYKDAFDDPHTTAYRLKYEMTFNAEGLPVLGTCAKGNDAD